MLDARVSRTDLGRIHALPERLDWAARRLVSRAAQEGAREMKIEAPKAFSTLANSVKADYLSPLSRWVGPHVAYARWVEEGRGPGTPPPFQPLLDWVRLKLGANDPERTARNLQHAIARRGVPAQPFVAPTAEWIVARLPALVAQYFRPES